MPSDDSAPAAGAAPTKAPIDIVTVIAIAVLVDLLADQLHELCGHGFACLAVGGTLHQLSSVALDCHGVTGGAARFVSAAGTLVNLLTAAILAPVLLRLRRGAPALRYFLWLFFTVSVLQGGGYLMVSPLARFGDWNAFVVGLSHPMAWRIGLTALGVAISVAGLVFAARRVEPFLGDDLALRKRRVWRLTLWPYLAMGTISCAAGAFNPYGAHLVVISAAASTFGGNAWLLWLPAWIRRKAPFDAPLAMRRSAGWIAAGAIAAIVVVAVLGPGLPRHPGP